MSGKKFVKGDLVCWTSQSRGIVSSKLGEIIEVIPKHKSLRDVVSGKKKFLKFNKNSIRTALEYSATRPEKSYLVLVNDRRLYWPVVSNLEYQ